MHIVAYNQSHNQLILAQMLQKSFQIISIRILTLGTPCAQKVPLKSGRMSVEEQQDKADLDLYKKQKNKIGPSISWCTFYISTDSSKYGYF